MDHIIDNVLDVRPLCFLPVRPKTVTRGVSFLECHTCHHPLPPFKTDPANLELLNAEGLLFVGHIDAFVVDAGPVFLPFRFTPWQQKASLLTSPKILKIHICFTATEGSPEHIP